MLKHRTDSFEVTRSIVDASRLHIQQQKNTQQKVLSIHQ